jgi:hypothetical protein
MENSVNSRVLLLKSHTGRKTFATLKNESGYPVPQIAAMLGNSEKICEQNYIKVSKLKILAELQRRA